MQSSNLPAGYIPDTDEVYENAYEHLWEKLNRKPSREEVENYLDELEDRAIGDQDER